MALKCFDAPAMGSEDRNRLSMYTAEKERRELQKTMSSPESWLASLDMNVIVETLSETNLPRVAQLINKTNQMNMRTRRMSEQELKEWTSCGNRQLWTFRLSDRFGDSGISGIISVELKKDAAYIEDFVMSCRVMGRQLEKVMIRTAVNFANQQQHATEVVAEYLETDRNRPCLEFWKNSGFNERMENRFFWEAADDYPAPKFIKVALADDNVESKAAV
jgi:FkbH-like protein